MNNYDTITALSISVYNGKPADIIRPHIPEGAIKTAWVPQTIGDCVWIFYKFESENKRIEWEKTLPPEISECLSRNLVDQIDVYGWGTRDFNGFKI